MKTVALLLILLGCATAASAAEKRVAVVGPENDSVQVDVVSQLKPATKIAIDAGNTTVAKDGIPVAMKHAMFIISALEKMKINKQSDVVLVIHGGAGYMLLSDAAFNQFKKTDTGNPFKDMIHKLQAKGVKVEMCAQTMRSNGWTNPEILEGIPVNSGANFRLAELAQNGYVILDR